MAPDFQPLALIFGRIEWSVGTPFDIDTSEAPALPTVWTPAGTGPVSDPIGFPLSAPYYVRLRFGLPFEKQDDGVGGKGQDQGTPESGGQDTGRVGTAAPPSILPPRIAPKPGGTDLNLGGIQKTDVRIVLSPDGPIRITRPVCGGDQTTGQDASTGPTKTPTTTTTEDTDGGEVLIVVFPGALRVVDAPDYVAQHKRGFLPVLFEVTGLGTNVTLQSSSQLEGTVGARTGRLVWELRVPGAGTSGRVLTSYVVHNQNANIDLPRPYAENGKGAFYNFHMAPSEIQRIGRTRTVTVATAFANQLDVSVIALPASETGRETGISLTTRYLGVDVYIDDRVYLIHLGEQRSGLALNRTSDQFERARAICQSLYGRGDKGPRVIEHYGNRRPDAYQGREEKAIRLDRSGSTGNRVSLLARLAGDKRSLLLGGYRHIQVARVEGANLSAAVVAYYRFSTAAKPYPLRGSKIPVCEVRRNFKERLGVKLHEGQTTAPVRVEGVRPEDVATGRKSWDFAGVSTSVLTTAGALQANPKFLSLLRTQKARVNQLATGIQIQAAATEEFRAALARSGEQARAPLDFARAQRSAARRIKVFRGLSGGLGLLASPGFGIGLALARGIASVCWSYISPEADGYPETEGAVEVLSGITIHRVDNRQGFLVRPRSSRTAGNVGAKKPLDVSYVRTAEVTVGDLVRIWQSYYLYVLQRADKGYDTRAIVSKSGFEAALALDAV